MRNISHDTWAGIIGTVYLGLVGNALLALACLPTVLILMTTDPSYSWPWIAASVPLSAPGVVGAFATFRAHRRGGSTVVSTFFAGWRTAWRGAVPLTALMVAVIVVLLVDVRAVSTNTFGVVVAPVLGVLIVLAASTGLVGLVAYSDVPRARLRDVLKASLYLSVKRWYLTVLSLIVLGLQFGLFTGMPAVGLGITAAPALYLAWAGSRYSLRPVLDEEEAPAL